MEKYKIKSKESMIGPMLMETWLLGGHYWRQETVISTVDILEGTQLSLEIGWPIALCFVANTLRHL